MSAERKYFGTDGIRGLVGKEPITPDFMVRLGYAAGRVFSKSKRSGNGQDVRVVIGKDTRLSGYMIEAALQSGLSAAGANVFLSGPIPTPGVAYLTKALRLDAGIVISASHNPYKDNGIKIFSGDGVKLSDSLELEIESLIDEGVDSIESQEVGKATRIHDAIGRYAEFCKGTFPREIDLKGINLIIDCANGATYQVAKTVFEELGASVKLIGNEPDGRNINDGCGALHPDFVKRHVLNEKADLGITFDGDGDRLILVDSDGRVYDGDQLLYVLAKYRSCSKKGLDGVVGTLMTNLAVENAIRQSNIPFARAAVGDRYVREMLVEKKWTLGGEGSGHIICLDKHSTGDAIISALEVLAILRSTQETLADRVKELTLYPQVLHNITLHEKLRPDQIEEIVTEGDRVSEKLGEDYRVLLRESGTEPLLRVMVEGRDLRVVEETVAQLTSSINAIIGQSQ